MNPVQLTAIDAALKIKQGELTAEELMQACLDRINEVDTNIQAWTHLDSEYALQQAQGVDSARQSGMDSGPLQGLPIGVKDIFDTADMPTENGTPLFAGREPADNAKVVSLLREAGAVIAGKTVTTELAVLFPGKTSNPHDPNRTPGGSSSGSAAAVAANMVPLAIGTQTNGSVIRPAAFCGVYGFKPTHGRISRHGVLLLSRALDTVGGFARGVEDLALLGESLMEFDERDHDMRVHSRPQLLDTTRAEPPLTPNIAFVKTPIWEQAEPDTKEGFGELADFLGENCDEVTLPQPFEQAVQYHRTIMTADLAKNLSSLYASGKNQLSDMLCGMIEEGQKCLAVEYNHALDMTAVLNAGLDEIFERYDAILTPSTKGVAPEGLESTGDPIFCTLWSLLGTPAVTLPLLQGANELPMGVQLVGRRYDDARLLRTARWLDQLVAEDS